MRLVIPESLLLRAVQALEEKAKSEAGHSQGDHLIHASESQAYKDSKAILFAIKNAKITAKVQGRR